MTRDEWTAEGTRRFGPDQMKWRFVCPSCGHVASVQDYKDAGAAVSVVAFSCIGRWMDRPRPAFTGGPGPCNYAGGGLISINPVEVDGHRYFGFAEAEATTAREL